MIQPTGDPIVYWLLRLLLIAILFYSGWNITKKYPKNKVFWRYCIPSIIAYSLIQGLRWNRGADYMSYYQILSGTHASENTEPLYLLWLDIFHFIGFPAPFGFVVYSTLLIISFCYLLKQFPSSAIWALPLFLLFTVSSENIVRQYIAASFLMLGIAAYLQGKRLFCSLFLVCSISIHFSAYIAIFVFVFIVLFPRLIKKIKWNKIYLFGLIGFYIFCYFFWDSSYFSSIANYLQTINIFEESSASSYIDDSERWFTEEGRISNVLNVNAGTFSLLHEASLFLVNLFIIIEGYLLLKNNSKLSVIYWFSYIAIVFRTIGGDIEIYARFREWFVYLTPIVCGLIIFRFQQSKGYNWVKILCFTVFLIYFVFYGIIRSFGTVGYSGCAFIWDTIV